MSTVKEVRPNVETHPAFGVAWMEAVAIGVSIFSGKIKRGECGGFFGARGGTALTSTAGSSAVATRSTTVINAKRIM